MNICAIDRATVTHAGSTYLAGVSLTDQTPVQKLDLLSGREFIWGLKMYAISINRYLEPGTSPTAITHVQEDLTINGHVFQDCWHIAWDLSTNKQIANGGFTLVENLVFLWYKQNPDPTL